MSEAVDPILHRAPCGLVSVIAPPNWQFPQRNVRVFPPLGDDPSADRVIQAALEANPDAHITVGIPATLLPADLAAHDYHKRLDRLSDPWRDHSRIEVVVIEGEGEIAALVDEAQKYDVALVGITRGNLLLRAVFGDPRHKLADRNPGPTLLVREYQGHFGVGLSRLWSSTKRLLPSLDGAERAEVSREVRRPGRPTRDFFMMIALSASIVAFGLFLKSAAVIIGAMLVAPLMSAIGGMGMAVNHGDPRFFLTCGTATLKGALVAIVTGVVVGWLTTVDTPTNEMLARGEPAYLDLAVALVSGFAAAYALSRRDLSSALPGVAIAVALVPPLATTGVSLAFGAWQLAWGALLLLLTNLTAITFASTVVFTALGFRPTEVTMTDRERAAVTERSFLATRALVIIVALVLGVETAEQLRHRTERSTIERVIPAFMESIGVRTSLWTWTLEESHGETPAELSIVLNATRPLRDSESSALRARLVTELDQDIDLNLSVVPTKIFPTD